MCRGSSLSPAGRLISAKETSVVPALSLQSRQDPELDQAPSFAKEKRPRVVPVGHLARGSPRPRCP